jgi:cysteinyl-tRNA synthetase
MIQKLPKFVFFGSFCQEPIVIHYFLMSKSFTLYDSYLKESVTIDSAQTIVPGTLKMYSCGPTVYNYMSIGNMRAAWFPDTIARLGEMLDLKVEWVSNITDVGHLVSDGDDGEDKLEKGAKRDGKKVEDIVNFYTEDFQKQCAALHFRLPTAQMNPRATEYIPEQMILALRLMAKGLAYLTDDGIYVDSQRAFEVFWEELDTISPQLKAILEKMKRQESGANTEFTDRQIVGGDKRSNADFAVWKFVSENALQKWKFNDYSEALWLWEQIKSLKMKDAPNVKNIADGGVSSITSEQSSFFKEMIDLENMLHRWGTPGWHSECVCMISQTVGGGLFSRAFQDVSSGAPEIDIHTGGEDHIDVHHQNEIIQSEALGFQLSKYWVHNKFVMIDGGKMSKSLGNVYLVVGDESDTGFKSLAGEGYDPLAYRLMLFEHSYTDQLNFTWDKLAQSQARLHSIRKDIAQIRSFWHEQGEPGVDVEMKQVEFYVDILRDNLNTPLFVEKFSKLVQETLNHILQNQELNVKNLALIQYLEEKVLDLDLLPQIPDGVRELVEKRWEAKQSKDYALSDQLRDDIAGLNWKVEDYAWGWGVWKVR